MPRKLPRIEPKFQYDFVLRISFAFDEVKKQRYLNFVLETVQYFVAFNYDLDVEVNFESKSKTITFQIHGFKPPSSPISHAGPAKFVYALHSYVNGVYTLRVVKGKNIENIFKIFVTKNKITLRSEAGKNKFVKLIIT